MSVSIAVRRTNTNYMGGRTKALIAKAQGGGRAALARAMQALGEPQMASGARRIAEHQAQSQPRYRIGDGQGLFLSRDGQGVTTCSRAAWFGSEEQLQNALKRFPLAAGMQGLRVIDGKVPYRAAIRQLWGSE